MKEEQFLSTHSSQWTELEGYCNRIAKKGIKKLSIEEINAFLKLFKLASHHLAYAKTHYQNGQTIFYLNNLVSQCNTYVYTMPKPDVIDSLKRLVKEYPKVIRQYRYYILVAFSIFLVGAIMSFGMVYFKPDYATLFLDKSIIEGVSSGTSGSHASSWDYPLMSSYIMTNNILVALRAFIFGITLGVGTIYILFYNGLILGSLTALFYLYGDTVKYWSLILPHGVIELSAIFISGAAGFVIAKRFLIPGELKRSHSVINGAKQALSLMGGVVIMLIVAGIIEGFFTPLDIKPISKLLFALLTAILLGLYMMSPYIKKAEITGGRADEES